MQPSGRARRRKPYRDHAAKREGGGFVPLPHAVLRSPEFARLSPRAVKMLCDLLSQYKGDNNGDLCAALTVMKPRGWSAGSLQRACVELREAGFIVLTRQGGRHRPSLYGVSFFEIDFCAGKLDFEAPTRRFMGAWRKSTPRLDARPLIAPRVAQLKLDCSAGGAMIRQVAQSAPLMEQS